MIKTGDPILTPSEIATHMLDAGQIDRATAMTLEQRIVGYVDSRVEEARSESRLQALVEAVDKAEFAVKRTKGERQKAVAQRILAAVKILLPSEAARRYENEQAEKRGYERAQWDRNKNGER